MLTRDFEVRPARCPSCGTNLTHATAVGAAAPPKPEDLTVCAYCAAVLVFTADLDYRILEPGELDQLRLFEPRTAADLDRAVTAVRQRRS